jgi:aspartokinase/homoserine dehydrogenase 1
MNILKFGGTSVAEPSRIKHIGELLSARIKQGENISIVCSAFSKVTDSLIQMGELAAKGNEDYLQVHQQFVERHDNALKELVSDDALSIAEKTLAENHDTLKQLLKGVYLVREVSPRTMDYILSFGERNSCFIIAQYLKESGLNAAFLDARKVIKTDKTFGAARVDFSLTNEYINAHFTKNPNTLNVITGFVASDVGGLTTTLGRGGSDYTAAIFAAALETEKLEIWTDVDGVLTCDPRKVSKAYTVESLSYNEAMELSHFGAKVIYPPTIQPALSKGIPIYIRNTFNPDFEGTKISKESDETNARIKGMSSMSGICLLTLQGSGMMGIPGIAARFFSSLARKKINVIMITQASSEHSICVAIKKGDKHDAITAIEEEFKNEIENAFVEPVSVFDDLTIIAVVGQNMRKIPGVAGRLFGALGKEGVNVAAIAQGSS